MGVSDCGDVVRSTVAEPRGPTAESERVEFAEEDGVAAKVMVEGLRDESSLTASRMFR